MTIEVNIAHKLGSFSLHAAFASEGGLTALFGQSGSGKSTIVNIIAGLIRPERGKVIIGGQTLLDTDRGLCVPCHRRKIGYVFQEGRLFPHLTVKQNLLYGHWFAQASTSQLQKVVDLLGLSTVLSRRPGNLSGGEKQRVAIGRALLSAPRLLLMDEPLASLDEARKQEILPYLERLRDETGVPIIYVSHAISEVIRLAKTMVLLSQGHVTAFGSTVDLMQRLELLPVTGGKDSGAIIEVEVMSHDDEYDLTLLYTKAGLWKVSRLDAQPGTKLTMRVKASDVMIALRPPKEISALNAIAAHIVEIGPKAGPTVEIKLDANGDRLVARLTRYSVEHLGLEMGLRVYAVIKAVTFDTVSKRPESLVS